MLLRSLDARNHEAIIGGVEEGRMVVDIEPGFPYKCQPIFISLMLLSLVCVPVLVSTIYKVVI